MSRPGEYYVIQVRDELEAAFGGPCGTVKQVAAYLNLSSDKVYRLVESRGIPCFRAGKRSVRFRASALARWIAQQEHDQTEGRIR